jgi:hypothetical protein
VLIGFIITLAGPLTSIKKIGPAPSLSVSGCESPVLSSWFDGGRSATARAVSFSLSRDLPPVSKEQSQQSFTRYQQPYRWSLFLDSRWMVASSSSVSMLWSPPSACVVKTRDNSDDVSITQGFAAPWPVLVAAERQWNNRYQHVLRPVRCQVSL